MPTSRRTDLRGADTEVLQIVALQSGDPGRVRGVLDPRNRISASLIPHVIPLLGNPLVAATAMQALQVVSDQHPGAFVDALLDPGRPPDVRRRLARVLSVCRSQVAVDGLLMTLEDAPLDLRVQCARSLFRVHRRSPGVRFDAARMIGLVSAELERGAPDLAHLFTLLAFVVPVKPLRAAYRGLTSDSRARGTALEYLSEVVPEEIRGDLLARLERRGD
jgi:hypothetical protein